MRCPICNQEAQSIWESSGGINGGCWFTGLYSCQNCGHFKASGTIRDNTRRIVQWHPSCPSHGPDSVLLTTVENHDFMTHDTEWICSACNRRMAVRDGRLVTTWMPQGPPVAVVDASLFLAQDRPRIGGLPHD